MICRVKNAAAFSMTPHSACRLRPPLQVPLLGPTPPVGKHFRLANLRFSLYCMPPISPFYFSAPHSGAGSTTSKAAPLWPPRFTPAGRLPNIPSHYSARADWLLRVAAASAPQPGRPANPCLETVLRAAGENTLIQQDPFRYLLSEAGEPFPRTPGSRTSAPRLWNK